MVPGSEPTSRRLRDAAGRVADASDEAQRAIVAIAGRLAGTVADLGKRGTRPDHVEVQLGGKFTAQGTIIVAGAAGEASLQVTVTYDRGGELTVAVPGYLGVLDAAGAAVGTCFPGGATPAGDRVARAGRRGCR